MLVCLFKKKMSKKISYFLKAGSVIRCLENSLDQLSIKGAGLQDTLQVRWDGGKLSAAVLMRKAIAQLNVESSVEFQISGNLNNLPSCFLSQTSQILVI